MSAKTKTQSAGSSDAVSTRVALEASWNRKVDEIILLSKTYYGVSDGGTGPVDHGVRRSRRLRTRTAEAYEQLAAIEDAMARLSDGRYGQRAALEPVRTGREDRPARGVRT